MQILNLFLSFFQMYNPILTVRFFFRFEFIFSEITFTQPHRYVISHHHVLYKFWICFLSSLAIEQIHFTFIHFSFFCFESGFFSPSPFWLCLFPHFARKFFHLAFLAILLFVPNLIFVILLECLPKLLPNQKLEKVLPRVSPFWSRKVLTMFQKLLSNPQLLPKRLRNVSTSLAIQSHADNSNISPAWEYCVWFSFSFVLKRRASFILKKIR